MFCRFAHSGWQNKLRHREPAKRRLNIPGDEKLLFSGRVVRTPNPALEYARDWFGVMPLVVGELLVCM